VILLSTVDDVSDEVGLDGTDRAGKRSDPHRGHGGGRVRRLG
jgi:hypothetical protein